MSTTSKFEQFMEDAEFNRFGIMSILILLNTIWGAMVCYNVVAFTDSLFLLIVSSFATTIPNAFCLAQSPMKWVIYGNFVGVTVNLLLFIVTLM